MVVGGGDAGIDAGEHLAGSPALRSFHVLCIVVAFSISGPDVLLWECSSKCGSVIVNVAV